MVYRSGPMPPLATLLERAAAGGRIDDGEALALLDAPLEGLLESAGARRDGARGRRVTYSPKVFIPLTTLCRDVCHYCTFAKPPRRGQRAFMTADEVLAVARAGAAAGCHEALFTLGDKPELRYRVAREELAALGCATTLEYLERMCRLVLEETGLLPHANPGVMSVDELARAAGGLRLAGHHAGDDVGAARAARRPALRLARQGPGGPPRHHRGRRRGRGAVHERHPHRHRRDPGRAARRAAGAAGAGRAARPSAGGHRPELPGQAGHQDGGPRPSRRWTTTAGRSRWRASCCRPR